mgnify:CR=1 FL=1
MLIALPSTMPMAAPEPGGGPDGAGGGARWGVCSVFRIALSEVVGSWWSTLGGRMAQVACNAIQADSSGVSRRVQK